MRRAVSIMAVCGCTFMLAFTAYRYGMFFDTSFYFWICLLALGGAASSLGMLVAGRRASFGGFTAEDDPAVKLLAAGALVIALLYMLALCFDPASVNGTVGQALRWIGYCGWLLLLCSLLQITGSRSFLIAALHLSGIFVTWGALLGWIGWSDFAEIVMVTTDEQLSATGARLAGFFQYPNMLGVVTAAYLGWQWTQLVHSSSRLVFLAAAVQSAPLAAVLLLTESRGAWLACCAGWAIGWWAAGTGKRALWLLYSCWTLFAAVWIYRLAMPAGMRSMEESGWSLEAAGGLLLAILAAALGFYMLNAARQGRWKERRLLHWLLPSIAAAAALAAVLYCLPATLSGRVNANYATASSRTLFYQDALSMFAEAPLLGRGGDTWRSLFTHFQSEPYVGSEVHSGYISLLLDIGLIGFACVVTMIGAILLFVARRNREGLVPLTVLLMHAAADFDMTYGFYWLLLFAWAALYIKRDEAAEIRLHPRSRKRRGLQRVLWSCAILLFIAAIGAGWRLDSAARYRAAAVHESGGEQARLLRAALAMNPSWTQVRLELAKLVQPEEQMGLLTAGLKYERQSPQLLWALGAGAADRNDVPQAVQLLEAAVEYDRFDRDKQSEAVLRLAQLAQLNEAANQLGEARLAAQTGVRIYEEFERLSRQSYRRNDRQFAGSDEAAAAADECKRILLRLPKQ
ncbi:O-antigen ligase family protein [Paenibacillus sp. GCM10027626]|uniref:O-antigen ligase family protein n=1 Tax=Paenibacillus sp. GCM10027626 TaxID=3273411 RepID=UPI0036291548